MLTNFTALIIARPRIEMPSRLGSPCEGCTSQLKSPCSHLRSRGQTQAICPFRSPGKLFAAKTCKFNRSKPSQSCLQGAAENFSRCEMHFSRVGSAKQLPCAFPAMAKYAHANVP